MANNSSFNACSSGVSATLNFPFIANLLYLLIKLHIHNFDSVTLSSGLDYLRCLARRERLGGVSSTIVKSAVTQVPKRG